MQMESLFWRSFRSTNQLPQTQFLLQQDGEGMGMNLLLVILLPMEVLPHFFIDTLNEPNACVCPFHTP